MYSGNIFNIVNTGDFVPYVVPECWDFTKFGSTREISSDSKVQNYYKALSGDSYNGLSTAGRIDLITAFSLYAPNRYLYNSSVTGVPPKYFGRAVGLAMSDAGALNAETLSLVAACGIEDNPSIGILIKLISGQGKITEVHCMETYLAMVFTKYA